MRPLEVSSWRSLPQLPRYGDARHNPESLQELARHPPHSRSTSLSPAEQRLRRMIYVARAAGGGASGVRGAFQRSVGCERVSAKRDWYALLLGSVVLGPAVGRLLCACVRLIRRHRMWRCRCHRNSAAAAALLRFYLRTGVIEGAIATSSPPGAARPCLGTALRHSTHLHDTRLNCLRRRSAS